METTGRRPAPPDCGEGADRDAPRASDLAGVLADMRARGVDEGKRFHDFQEYLAEKARKRNVPISGILELTPVCNLDCGMCYVHSRCRRYSPEEIRPADDWVRLIDQACDAGMLDCQLTGGECLTHPGFDEIFLRLRARGIETTVLSNGILMDEERIDFFRKYPPAYIQISVYGSDDDAYERVTGHRVFSIVKGNLIRLRDAGLRVTAAVTVSRRMLGDLSDTVALLKALDIPANFGTDLMPPYENVVQRYEDFRLSAEETVLARKLIARSEGKELAEIDPSALPAPRASGCAPVRGLACGGGRSSFAVNWQGELSACHTAMNLFRVPVGDDFYGAWRKVNDWVRNHMIPHRCDDCHYMSVCNRCALQQELCMGAAGAVDPEYCKMIRDSVAAGIFKNPE